VPSEQQETLLHCEGDPALGQVAQASCEVALLGDTQKPSRHGPGQPVPDGPA